MDRGRLLRYFALLVALAAVFPAAVHPSAPPAASPKPDRLPASIKVVMDDNYPPYAFRDESGALQGVLIDRWRLWEAKTGVRVEIHGMDWGEALRRMEAGEFDVIDTIFRSESRERIYDFSRPHARLEVPAFFHRNISGITDVSSLREFPVAVKSGDAAIEFLLDHGVTRLVSYDSYEKIVRAARDHEVGVFVADRPPAMYFLYKMGIQDQFQASGPLFIGEFHRAVLKGRTELLAAVEEGFARIPRQEKDGIDRKWFGSATISLSELRYLGIGAALAMALLLALAVWNRTLRRSVDRKTAELQAEMELTASQARRLRVSEENYRLVVENANDGILILRDGRILFSNQQVARFLGVPLPELSGRDFGGFVHPEDRERVTGYHAMRMRGEDAPSRYDFRIQSDSGETVWVQANVVFTMWEGGRAAVSFLRDISLEKKLADQLVHSRKMEAIGRLAGGIAHDFNNLLSVVLGYSNLLLCRPDGGAPHAKEIREIGKAAERAADLTRQLLAFSRKQLLQPKVVNLNDIVSGMTNSLRRLVREDIEVSSSLQEALPAVLVDPGQVEQVILNLAVNAKDAMPRGGRLRIGTKSVALSGEFAREHPPLEPGSHVVLYVSDTGTGMEKGILQKIFEPFFTTKELGKGTGLGLATVDGIVSQSRGLVCVESEPGKGTTFSIYLPVAGQAPPEPDAIGPERHAGGDGTVLVAEDDPAVRSLVREVLAAGGYTVLEANGGEEALRTARAHPGPIRVLVTDVVMPGMSGPALATDMLREHPGVKVLYMSGYAADSMGSGDAMGEGIELIEKPFSPSALLEKVRKVLEA